MGQIGTRLTGGILTAALLMGLGAGASAASFADVAQDHWAAAGIQRMMERGLFRGTGAETFSPQAPMSRAMLVSVLYRYAGSPAVTGSAAAVTPFQDVPAGSWYEDAVVWACQEDLMPEWFLYRNEEESGAERTRFEPECPMLRMDLLEMLHSFSVEFGGDTYFDRSYFQYVGTGTLFPDLEEDALHQAIAAAYPDYQAGENDGLGIDDIVLCWAYPQGILAGRGDGRMDLTGTVSRAEAAAILDRYDRLPHSGESEE